MTIQIPNLDTRVRLERKKVTQDAVYGTEVISWVLVATVWAEVMDQLPTRQQAEQMRNNTQVSVRRSRVRMRYRNDIDASMRCIIAGVTHQIVGGPAMIGRNELVELLIERTST